MPVGTTSCSSSSGEVGCVPLLWLGSSLTAVSWLAAPLTPDHLITTSETACFSCQPGFTFFFFFDPTAELMTHFQADMLTRARMLSTGRQRQLGLWSTRLPASVPSVPAAESHPPVASIHERWVARWHSVCRRFQWVLQVWSRSRTLLCGR